MKVVEKEGIWVIKDLVHGIIEIQLIIRGLITQLSILDNHENIVLTLKKCQY